MADVTKKGAGKATKLSIAFLIIGGLLTFFAISILPRQITPPERLPSRSRGFLFESTEMIQLNQSEIKMAFNEIDCENGTAKCEIMANPLLNKSSEYSSAFFILQIPYKIENLEIIFGTKNPEYYGGKRTVQENNSLTQVMFNIPKETNYITYNKKGTPTIIFTFTIKSAFNQIDWYTYEMPITWGGSLNSAVNDIENFENLNFYYTLHIFATQRSLLHVERTQKYYYSSIQPDFDRIEPWFNLDSAYFWDLKSISSKGGENSVILELVNLESKYKVDLQKSLVWLFSGIGVPLAFGSAIELIKNWGLVDPEVKQGWGKYIIAFIIFGVPIYLVLINFLIRNVLLTV